MSLDHHDHRLFDDIGDSVCAAIENGRPTLRDRFAMAALTGILASDHVSAQTGPIMQAPDDHLAKTAYMLADAMLAERAK